MLSIIAAIVAAVVGIYACRFALKFVRAEACRERLRLEHANEFYQAASNLADDPDTPDTILETLEMMNETIADAGAPRFLMSWFARGKQIEDGRTQLNKIAREFFAKRPELEPSWEKSLAQWFLAVSYLSWWRGPILRSAINDGELVSAARSVKNNRCKDHPLGPRDTRVPA